MYITWAYIHTYIHGFAYCIKLEFLDINYTLLGVVVAYQTVFLSSRNTTTIIFLCCCVLYVSFFFFYNFFFFYLIVYLISVLILFCCFVFCVTFLQLNLKRHDCSSPEGSMAYREKWYLFLIFTSNLFVYWNELFNMFENKSYFFLNFLRW